MLCKNQYFWIGLLFLSSWIGCVNDPQPIVDKKSEVKVAHTLATARNLISITTLKKWLPNIRKLKVLEVSQPAEYAKGHLPLAQHIWRPDYENSTDYAYSGMRAGAQHMQNLLTDLGVATGDTLVLYDTKGSCDAVRLGWILESYGKSNVFIVNGGKKAWQLANWPMEQGNVVFKPSVFQYEKTPQLVEIATKDSVMKAIKDTNTLLLDTRESYEYLGQPFSKKNEKYHFKKGAYAYGCIPTAIHYNWSNAVDLKGDHCIKSIEELKYDLEKANISPDKSIIVYCQSGVRSAHTTYVLKEVLGYPNVKNYDGSWIEWSYLYAHKGTVEIEQHISEVEHARLFDEL